MKRDWLERFIQIGTSEMYGSVDHAANEDEPIKPSSPYAASKVAFDMYLAVGAPVPEVPHEHHPAVERLLPGTAPASRDPESDLVRTDRQQAAAARRRTRGEVLYPCPRSRAKPSTSSPRRRRSATIYNAGPAQPTSIREVVERTRQRAWASRSRTSCEMSADRLGQDLRYWLDSIRRSKRDIGWEPRTGWDEGLADMVAWGRKYADEIRDWPTEYVLASLTCKDTQATLERAAPVCATTSMRPRRASVALTYRRRILDVSQQVTAMHVAPAFSCTEIVDVIYHGLMRWTAPGQSPDVFLMSKGHGCLIQYVILEEMGMLAREDLDRYCKPDGRLGAHPDFGVPGIAASTGSLGHGMGIATGMAYAERLQKRDGKVYLRAQRRRVPGGLDLGRRP